MTDPISDIPKESPRSILFQFVLFPLGIVCVGVAIFLLFGRLANEEHTIPDYLNAIRAGSSHERWQAAYQLSKSLKRGEAKRYPNLEEQVASIYRASKTDDPRIRQYLSMVLGTIGDRRATPVLLEALGDRETETRLYAIIALGELKDPASVPQLIETTRDGDKDVRKTAFYALGEIHDPRAVDALVAGLDDQVADARWNAAIALSQFGDRRAAPVLRTMLDRSMLDRVAGIREDQKEDAMITALSVYPKLVGAEARPELQKIAASDPSLSVRDAAKQAMTSIR
jgi:HEAT repeat protein